MADNINYSNGKYSFYSKKEIAWHSLGEVGNAVVSEELILKSNANFIVGKENLYVNIDNQNILVDGSFATTRLDTNIPLGIVGRDYKVIQNLEVFKFFDDLVGMNHSYYETAGVLGKGETVFVSMKFPEDEFSIIKDDNIENYIVITNSHDGKSSLKVLFTPIRVVCNNTLTMALKNSNCQYSIRHSGDIKYKMNILKELIRTNHNYIDEIKNILTKIKDIKVTDSKAQNIIVDNFVNPEQYRLYERNNYKYDDIEEISQRMKNTISSCLDYTYNGVGQNINVNSGYWLFNGVNGFYNNAKNYSNPETRFKNVVETEGKKASEFVLDKVLTLN